MLRVLCRIRGLIGFARLYAGDSPAPGRFRLEAELCRCPPPFRMAVMVERLIVTTNPSLVFQRHGRPGTGDPKRMAYDGCECNGECRNPCAQKGDRDQRGRECREASDASSS